MTTSQNRQAMIGVDQSISVLVGADEEWAIFRLNFDEFYYISAKMLYSKTLL